MAIHDKKDPIKQEKNLSTEKGQSAPAGASAAPFKAEQVLSESAEHKEHNKRSLAAHKDDLKLAAKLRANWHAYVEEQHGTIH